MPYNRDKKVRKLSRTYVERKYIELRACSLNQQLINNFSELHYTWMRSINVQKLTTDNRC